MSLGIGNEKGCGLERVNSNYLNALDATLTLLVVLKAFESPMVFVQFQKHLHEVMADLARVICIVDNMLIYGSEDTGPGNHHRRMQWKKSRTKAP